MMDEGMEKGEQVIKVSKESTESSLIQLKKQLAGFGKTLHDTSILSLTRLQICSIKLKATAGEAVDKIAESEFVQKAENFTEKVGEKVVEKSDAAWDPIDKAKDVIADKAKDVAGKISDKFDETVEKQRILVEEDEKKKPKRNLPMKH